MQNSLPSLSALPKTEAQQAALTLLERRATRTNFIDWALHCGFEPALHHRALIDKLERVLRGDCTRLLICMPPGSAKSTYASVLFPAFFLANLPEASIIAASHTSELAEWWGRRVRNLLIEHHQTIGITPRADTTAAGRWETEAGGSYLAVGVGQAVVGYRADLAVIDDPVRSREDAFSETVRRNTYEWFCAELRTRLRPGGRIVLIMTRWHGADLAGRLLEEAEKGGECWEQLVLPAVAEENDPIGRKPGEYLWQGDPKYDYAGTLRQEQKNQSPMNWAALFQQRPAPESGDFFQAEWLHPYDTPHDLKELRIYAASDYATTAKGGDWTVHVIVGIDPIRRMFLLDLWRAQTTPDYWVEKMLDLALKWKPITWAEESGQIKSSVGPFIDSRMRERKIPIYRKVFPTKHDKPTRAQSIRGLMALRGLYVPTKAAWYAAFQQELLSFPAGKHDDQVDAIALVGQLLDVIMPGIVVKAERKFELPKDYVEIDEENKRVMYDNTFNLHDGAEGEGYFGKFAPSFKTL